MEQDEAKLPQDGETAQEAGDTLTFEGSEQKEQNKCADLDHEPFDGPGARVSEDAAWMDVSSERLLEAQAAHSEEDDGEVRGVAEGTGWENDDDIPLQPRSPVVRRIYP